MFPDGDGAGEGVRQDKLFEFRIHSTTRACVQEQASGNLVVLSKLSGFGQG